MAKLRFNQHLYLNFSTVFRNPLTEHIFDYKAKKQSFIFLRKMFLNDELLILFCATEM
jgi:hypothetical protein